MSERTCQPCTACCDGWVRMTIAGQAVHPGRPCVHSTGKGCADYANRPVDPCVRFACGWVAPDSPLPDWMQPHRAKVLVIFNKMQWRDRPVDLALPVGRAIPGRALSWLKSFSGRTGRPLIYGEQVSENGMFTGQQDMRAWGPTEFLRDIEDWGARGLLKL